MHKRKGITPDKLLKILEFWHSFLQNVEIKCGDYEEVYTPQAKDFLFLDSPYLGTSSQYLADAKNFDFERLKSFLQKLDNHGINFMCCLDDKIPKDFLPFSSFKTTAKSSSFSRHKGIDKKVGDTIFINY
jgi:site-specific DNA-adenine methylase